MRRPLAAALAAGLCFAAAAGAARGQDAGARARELAAHFNKDKHKVKEKRGARLEVFLEMRGEPAVRADATEYTGVYESEPDYKLDLRVAPDGGAEGRGTEPAPGGARGFTLRGARVSGAVLAGTKVYDDGTTERLEAVFATLTTRHSPDGAGTSLFGLGVVFDSPRTTGGGFEVTKLFYARKR
ncbi:MAG TPA: hypothetical protein VF659_23030 [Pyrinomonadaceae bacterium]|jgi:hypothetical protein